uniref:Uncharacterized protein n=1 Tax=Photinus pyralis TaxID=7054 RepID=A0A1Y1LN56_PHOPY
MRIELVTWYSHVAPNVIAHFAITCYSLKCIRRTRRLIAPLFSFTPPARTRTFPNRHSLPKLRAEKRKEKTSECRELPSVNPQIKKGRKEKDGRKTLNESIRGTSRVLQRVAAAIISFLPTHNSRVKSIFTSSVLAAASLR